MIVISMDEGGKFEQMSGSQCNLIGGLAYQCANKADAERESDSLANFFQTVCAEQQCRYPYDLHFNWNNGRIINAEAAAKVKKALGQELPDYLQKKGRWQSGRPAGQYCVFCMIGDQTELFSHPAGSISDSIATIRYDHMIYRTVENMLLYNPRFADEKQYDLRLPTRVINLSDRSLTDRAKIEKELISLGYRRHKNDDNTLDADVYEVTDGTSFRAFLETALQNRDRKDLQISLAVNSIYYKADKKKQRYLYLADSLCSVFQDAVSGMTTCAKAAPALAECGKKLAGNGNMLLWAYHPVDVRWRNLWDSYQHGNWFDALTAACGIRNSRAAVDKAYQPLVKDFEKTLTETSMDLRRIRALEDALTRLDDYMTDMQKRQQTTGLYIIDQLKKCHEQIGNPVIRGRQDYLFAKILTGLYNHRGDFRRADAEFKKCIEAARYVTIEEYLGVQLLHIVSLLDAGRYEEAEKLAATILSHHELINDIRKEIYPENKLIPDSYGRALSQHGQALALLGRYDEAISEFRKALEIFEPHRKDWQMTGSYLLHVLIEKNDRQAFNAFAKEYFCAGTPAKQYKAILNYECGSIPFALYLFLKGLWVFGETETDPGLIRKIIEETEKEFPDTKPEHPREQVMKYCAFLWHRYFEENGDHSHSEKLMANAASVLKEAEGVLERIRNENEAQYSNVIQDKPYLTGCELRFIYC